MGKYSFKNGRMRMFISGMIILLAWFCSINIICAQPPQKYINVIVTPDHSNWEYKVGEKANFTITVLRNGNPIKGVEVTCKISQERMKNGKTISKILGDGEVTVEGGTMQIPGFLCCSASVVIDGITYSGYAQIGFDVDQIKTKTTLPDDFEAFWDAAKKDLAKVPVEATITLLPNRCTEKVNVYHVGIKNVSGKIYGILCKPKKEGKYPVILQLPGAGTRPYNGDIINAAKGIITLEIGIHGIPVNLSPKVYEDLSAGICKDYWASNMDDRDRYYFKRVYLGCVRAIDFLCSLPECDGENIAVHGGSQGGALSIVTASLDSRVKYLVAYYPGFCDIAGHYESRAARWPHYHDDITNKNEKIEVSKYYDVVNFARFIKVPGFYSWGYNDKVCPPTSVYSAYNMIKAPKEKSVFLNAGHWTYPEQAKKGTDWLMKKLTKK